jgi:septation ring formation regulator EzrA
MMSEYAEEQLVRIAKAVEQIAAGVEKENKQSEPNYSEAVVHMSYAQQIAEAIEGNGANMFDLLKKFRKIESKARQTAEALIQ